MAHYNGSAWTPYAGPVTNDITEFQCIAEDQMYASVYGGQLLFFDDGKWEAVQSNSRASFTGIAVDEPDRIRLAGLAGTLITFENQSSPTPTTVPDCVNSGDVTLDGNITAGDAQLAFQIVMGAYMPSFEEQCAADCNGNGVVTAGDAQEIFMAALGMGMCEDTV